jgi:hypothetical protein
MIQGVATRFWWTKKFYLQQHYLQMSSLDTTTYLPRKLLKYKTPMIYCYFYKLSYYQNKLLFKLCFMLTNHDINTWIQTIVHENHLQGVKFVVHIEVQGYFFQHLKKWGNNICKVTCMATHSNVLHEEIRLLSSIFFFPLKNLQSCSF